MAKTDSRKQIVGNKKARHEYFIEDTYEAGLSLTGTEVKSLRAGRANLNDAYATIRNDEIYILGLHISPYEQGNINNVDPLRERKLLLHKNEIRAIKSAAERDGYTLVPLDLHFKGSYVKLSLAVAKGKKLYDKRQTLKEKDAKRETDRAMKQRY